MRDEIDQIIEILTIIFGVGYLASALYLKYPILYYLYQDLAIFSIILLILDIIYHLFSRRLYPLKEKVSSPIIIGIFILLFIGFISLNPSIYLQVTLQTLPIEETSLQIELLPHVSVLLLMVTTLFISNTVENHYHNKLSDAVRRVLESE